MNQSKWYLSSQIYIILALVVLIILGIVLRFPLVSYNLPVSSHVDERPGLWMLYRFYMGDLDPGNFSKPTFYYYLTYFASRPFVRDASDLLSYGRVVNLLLGCLLILVVFLLGKHVLHSSRIGLIASLLVASSPILIMNGGYIITDILLAVTSLLALLFFGLFFERKDYKYWFAGAMMGGLALSSKYVSAVPVLLTYLIYEFFSKGSTDASHSVKHLLERPFSPLWLSGMALLAGLALLAVYSFFPSYDWIASFVQQQGSLSASLEPEDVAMIESLRTTTLALAILSWALFLLSLFFRSFFARFCYPRPYVALIFALIFFSVGSPFLLISWKKAIYGFATTMKDNAVSSGQRQWVTFIVHYLTNESILAVVFLPLGVYALVKRKEPWPLLVIYVVLSYLAYGSGNRVFARYWTPTLPAVFILAAAGISFVVDQLKALRWRHLSTGFLALLVVLVGLELQPKYGALVVDRTAQTNSAYGAYYWVLEEGPDRVYYPSGAWVPHAELIMRGYDFEEVDRGWIATGDLSLLRHMGERDVLILDGRQEVQMSPSLRQNFTLEWSSEKDHGQYIYRKRQDTSE